jgi:hypothetical protein
VVAQLTVDVPLPAPRGEPAARAERCGVLRTVAVSGECAKVVARHSSTGLS